MLDIQKNVALADYTTIKIGSLAEFFVVVENRDELLEAIKWANDKKKKIFILGGGSNLLITKKIKGLVIKNEIHGMRVVEEDDDNAILSSDSGELWSRFVSFSVDKELYGMENLFLIPGTVGAAPMQNIGAYGAELKDVFYSLTAVNLKTGKEKIFKLKDCGFAYRNSIFKKKLKGKYFICSVEVKLSKKPEFNLEYGAIKDKLKERGIHTPRSKDVIDIIQEIRNSKLPNPVNIPNAGSFFKNPEVSIKQFKKIQDKYPEVPNFPSQIKKKIKIPAGWLIDQSGFKGKEFGPVGMYESQALILVNRGGAEAKDVLALVKKIKDKVREDFGLDLEEEVNII